MGILLAISPNTFDVQIVCVFYLSSPSYVLALVNRLSYRPLFPAWRPIIHLYYISFWHGPFSRPSFLQIPGSGDGHLMRRATATTTSPTPTSTCGCSTYGICAYGTPYADVVVLDYVGILLATHPAKMIAATVSLLTSFSTSDCYLWYSAFNQSQCGLLQSWKWSLRQGCGCVSSSSSSSTTASSTSTASSISTSSTSSSSTAITTSSLSIVVIYSGRQVPRPLQRLLQLHREVTRYAPISWCVHRPNPTILFHNLRPQCTWYSISIGHCSIRQTTLPALNSSATYGNFGASLFLNEPPRITHSPMERNVFIPNILWHSIRRLNADPDGGADGSDFGNSALA